MICEKCNAQFKSETPISESRRMFGLCKKCGVKLKYSEIPPSFLGGATAAVISTPFLFLVLFNWVSLIYILASVTGCYLLVRFVTAKVGGYVYLESIEEFKKGNFFLKSISGVLGLIVGFSILLLFLVLLN
jgi:hypothetical protein